MVHVRHGRVIDFFRGDDLVLAVHGRLVVDCQLLSATCLQADESICRALLGKLLDLDGRLNGELFRQDGLRLVPLSVQVDDERRGDANLVLQLAGDLELHGGGVVGVAKMARMAGITWVARDRSPVRAVI